MYIFFYLTPRWVISDLISAAKTAEKTCNILSKHKLNFTHLKDNSFLKMHIPVKQVVLIIQIKRDH